MFMNLSGLAALSSFKHKPVSSQPFATNLLIFKTPTEKWQWISFWKQRNKIQILAEIFHNL